MFPVASRVLLVFQLPAGEANQSTADLTGLGWLPHSYSFGRHESPTGPAFQLSFTQVSFQPSLLSRRLEQGRVQMHSESTVEKTVQISISCI